MYIFSLADLGGSLFVCGHAKGGTTVEETRDSMNAT
jgi:hypothetical protein